MAVRKGSTRSGYLLIPARRRNGRIVVQRNVAAGFVDSGGKFHPIRASADYDATRTGEDLGDRKRKKTKKKGWRY